MIIILEAARGQHAVEVVVLERSEGRVRFRGFGKDLVTGELVCVMFFGQRIREAVRLFEEDES